MHTTRRFAKEDGWRVIKHEPEYRVKGPDVDPYEGWKQSILERERKKNNFVRQYNSPPSPVENRSGPGCIYDSCRDPEYCQQGGSCSIAVAPSPRSRRYLRWADLAKAADVNKNHQIDPEEQELLDQLIDHYKWEG
jgi:hypothetical protein